MIACLMPLANERNIINKPYAGLVHTGVEVDVFCENTNFCIDASITITQPLCLVDREVALPHLPVTVFVFPSLPG